MHAVEPSAGRARRRRPRSEALGTSEFARLAADGMRLADIGVAQTAFGEV